MSSHVVQSGDTLSGLSVRYYGVATEWKKIANANPQLTARGRAADGSPLLFVGDILIIPEANGAALRNDGTISDEGFVLVIADKKIDTFTGYTLRISCDSLDVFSFSTYWDEDFDDLYENFVPFSYKKCAVYFKDKIVFQGVLMDSTPVITADDRSVTVQGYPLCGVLNDCCYPAIDESVNFYDLNLKQIAEKMCEPFNIDCVFADDPGEAFEEVEYSIGSTVFSFIKTLAEQRNFVFTNDSEGRLLFWKIPEYEVSSIYKEGDLNFIACTPNFKQQGMFSHLTGFSKGDVIEDPSSFTFENKFLTKKGVFRPTSFVCEDAITSDEVEKAVISKAGQMFLNACTYTLIVYGCTDNHGRLFNKGMCVSVYAPSGMIYRETKFQVKDLEIKKSDSEGLITTLTLVLPDSFVANLPDKLPWEK